MRYNVCMDDLIRWLLRDAAVLDDADFVEQLALRLRGVGVPIDRLWFGVPRMHPLLVTAALLWTDGLGAQLLELPLSRRDSMRNDIAQWGGGRHDWHRIKIAEAPPEVAGLPRALWDEGYTEVLLGRRFAEGPIPDLRVQNVQSNRGFIQTVATRAVGGFSDDAIATMNAIEDALFTSIWLRTERSFSQVLAHTYLGRDPGDQVLRGQLHRGDIETTRAAIAFADLRGFSALSEETPPNEVLELLGEFFDVLVGNIDATGGDVLQFMGDGLLAIWPQRDGHASDACDAALLAVERTTDRLAIVNDARAEAGRPRIRWGVALHFGDVSYGNMGAAHRLAFTVLGPAVNQAARLETIGASLGLVPVVSERFAQLTTATCVSYGRFKAKGVGEIEAWGLTPDVTL